MATDKNALGHLRSIDASLQAIVQLLQRQGGNGSAGPMIADDRDLDSQYGDPQVKFHPRDWHGDNCKGLRMSECPAEFLDLLAGAFDYFAKKAEESDERTSAGKPVAPYKRKDAARARGWAQRIRNAGPGVNRSTGEVVDPAWEPPAPASFDGGFEEPPITDDDIPF